MYSRTYKIIIALFLAILVLGGCSNDGSSDSGGNSGGGSTTTKSITSLSGVAQKGAFLEGSIVSLCKLDEKMDCTSEKLEVKVSDDKGSYDFEKLSWSGLSRLTISGYYLDELSGEKSHTRATITAIVDIKSKVKQKSNTNLLTDLQAKRMKELVEKGKSIVNASDEAKEDIKKLFNVSADDFTELNLVDFSAGKASVNVELLRISAAVANAEDPVAALEELMKIYNEYGIEGVLNSTLYKQLMGLIKDVQVKDVIAQLVGTEVANAVTIEDIAPFAIANIVTYGSVDADAKVRVTLIGTEFINTDGVSVSSSNSLLGIDAKHLSDDNTSVILDMNQATSCQDINVTFTIASTSLKEVSSSITTPRIHYRNDILYCATENTNGEDLGTITMTPGAIISLVPLRNNQIRLTLFGTEFENYTDSIEAQLITSSDTLAIDQAVVADDNRSVVFTLNQNTDYCADDNVTIELDAAYLKDRDIRLTSNKIRYVSPNVISLCNDNTNVIPISFNRAPTVSITPDALSPVPMGTAVEFNATAVDENSEDTVTLFWKYKRADSDLYSAGRTGSKFTHTFMSAGNYIVEVRATDNHGASATASVEFEVVTDQASPKAFEITDYYGVEINQYYDTFLTVDWLEDGASANISSSGYDGQETHSGFSVNGDNSITTVSNGDIVRVGHLSSNEYGTELHTTITIGEDSADFITRTKASQSANLPLIVGAPKMSGNLHENYSYTPQMSTDYDHFAPVTKPFEIQNGPNWAIFNPTTGELSGVPTQAGIYKGVKIIAYGDNGLDDITFDISIENNGPYMNGNNLSLENSNLELTYNDNSDWRAKVTQVSLYSCYQQSTPSILASSDYTFSAGALVLHDSTSSNVALHTPSMGGARLIVKSEGYQDSESYLDMIADGQYGIDATLSASTPLTEENLDGATVEISLANALAFKDTTLETSNFTFSNAPQDLRIDTVTYKDATHAELTLAYNGIDFDTDALLSLSIAASELNTPCAMTETNTIDVVAMIEKPFINMLYPDDPSEGAHFGYSVADNNDTIAVGSKTGLYIFKKGADGNYTQRQKIASSTGHNFFASSLAMDGDYLLVGDGNYKNMDTNKSFVGSADVYKKDANGDYQLLQDLTPADNAEYDHFGASLDISKDMIIVGAYNGDEHKGKAYLYKKDGSGNFTLINTLTRANGKAMDSFGYDVAITHGLDGTPEENNYFILVGSNVMPYIYEDNGELVTDTKEELGAGFANYYVYIDDVLSDPIVMSADDSSDLADHFGSAVALDAVMVTIGSNKRVYVYARGEGDAIGQRSKIENAGSASGKGLEVQWSGFDNHARYVVVAGRQSFISKEDWTFNRYESSLVNNDDLGYAASVSDFEVAYGSYKNSDLVSEGGAVLVTHAYENITSVTNSAMTLIQK